MVNLLVIEKELDKLKQIFMDFMRTYSVQLRQQALKEVSKELNRKQLLQLEEMERKQLSKPNAAFFLKCVKVIEEIENIGAQRAKGKISKLAQEFGLTESEIEVLMACVRYNQLYRKFTANKEEILRYI